MDVWDLDATELLGPALIHIEPTGRRRFGFVAVEGELDWKPDSARRLAASRSRGKGHDEGDR